MEDCGHDTYQNDAKYDAMKTPSGSDTTDFATRSGDLGQAYAECIGDRYLNGNASAMTRWATDEELLGDLHGYLAVEVWRHVPAAESPTGHERKVSDCLRDMYPVPRPRAPYRGTFERVSGTASADVRAFIRERTPAFARLWHAKPAYAKVGWSGSDGWEPTEILKNHRKYFDRHRGTNETSANPNAELDTVVEDLLRRLEAK